MISPKDAVKTVSKYYPNRNPLAIFDYDDEYYIVSAPLKKASSVSSPTRAA